MSFSDKRNDLQTYYAQRAQVYEAIYHRPDAARLTEQENLARAIRVFCKNKDVLEIACGTGWWTVHAAATARHVTATDAVAETLAVAKTKPFPPSRVTFRVADAFDLGALQEKFDAILACFFLSHVAHADRPRFLQSLLQALRPGGMLFLADNKLVPDLGGALVTKPGCPDSFKRRLREDGTEQEVLKNYDTPESLHDLFDPIAAARNFSLHQGVHFWQLRLHRGPSCGPSFPGEDLKTLVCCGRPASFKGTSP